MSGRKSKRGRALCLSAVLVSAAIAGEAQIRYQPAPAVRVTIDEGTLQGAEPASGIRAFLGIPYAKPPVGELRWQPPQPFDSWQGTRLAVSHGAACMQQKFGWNDSAAEHSSEDCLFLNVWAPAAGHQLPVMVYIHGGSNIAGSAAEDLSNGLTLMPRGVVLVTIDYRLGVFGFFRTAELDRESPHHASGNYGLLDQIAALRWIRRNIAQFGGDPKNVTIFGQSAGAVDTGLLMTSPLARGLFQKALEESGQVLGLMPTGTAAQAEDGWKPVAAMLGPDLAAMRRASAADVLKADGAVPRPVPGNWWGYRGASIDGWVLKETPSAVFAAGTEAPVPLVIGSNVQEIVAGQQPAEETHRSIESSLGSALAAKLEAVYAQPGADPLLGETATRWATDRDFRCPVQQIAAWHAVHGFPTFVYEFDRAVPGKPRAEHSSELFFVFHYFPAHNESVDDDSISAAVQSYWTSFARTGSPGEPGLMPWPRYSADNKYFLRFPAIGSRPEVQSDPGGKACAVVNSAGRTAR